MVVVVGGGGGGGSVPNRVHAKRLHNITTRRHITLTLFTDVTTLVRIQFIGGTDAYHRRVVSLLLQVLHQERHDTF